MRLFLTELMLKNRICLITGANRGIGAVIAKTFAAQGAHLWLTAREPGKLDDLKKECQSLSGTEVNCLYFDVRQENQVKQAFRQLHSEVKGLDVLVNNAGILQDALLGMVTSSQLEAVYQTNVFGALYCSQYASRLMARRKGGSIINLSSIIGKNGNAGQAVYSGSKAAVIGMTQSLAKELASQKIRVNAIAPGFIDTDMARQLSPTIFQQRVNSVAMGSIGQAKDIANAALFFASDLSTYVTGQVLGVDGGMLI
jgi:3-oxoacyl-[acyl-carrier protein] reductase